MVRLKIVKFVTVQVTYTKYSTEEKHNITDM